MTLLIIFEAVQFLLYHLLQNPLTENICALTFAIQLVLPISHETNLRYFALLNLSSKSEVIMTVDTTHSMESVTTARVGTKLPHHEEVSERITLGILTLYDKLRSLETLEPDPINGRLFNQLFDLVTMSKTTTAQEQQASWHHLIRVASLD